MATRSEIKSYLSEKEIQVSSKFTPNCQREGREDFFHYTVSLFYGGKIILETIYSMGYGHSPNYREYSKNPRSLLLDQLKKRELKTGIAATVNGFVSIVPDPLDIVSCLILDSDVLDYDSFENWAEALGYDTDSRNAERIYLECMKTAHSLRNGLGETILSELQDLFQDY